MNPALDRRGFDLRLKVGQGRRENIVVVVMDRDSARGSIDVDQFFTVFCVDGYHDPEDARAAEVHQLLVITKLIEQPAENWLNSQV